jgi:hypothetical protein
MPQFSDEYFRDLPPRDRRYDTPVADQLVFSVFPNGVKAWVHVYPCDDFVRRRTIGLFPEMSLVAARAALEQSRRIAEVDARQIRPPKKRMPLSTRIIVTAVVAAAVSSLLTFLFIRPTPPGDAAQPDVHAPSAGAEDRLPAGDEQEQSDADDSGGVPPPRTDETRGGDPVSRTLDDGQRQRDASTGPDEVESPERDSAVVPDEAPPEEEDE